MINIEVLAEEFRGDGQPLDLLLSPIAGNIIEAFYVCITLQTKFFIDTCRNVASIDHGVDLLTRIVIVWVPINVNERDVWTEPLIAISIHINLIRYKLFESVANCILVVLRRILLKQVLARCRVKPLELDWFRRIVPVNSEVLHSDKTVDVILHDIKPLD